MISSALEIDLRFSLLRLLHATGHILACMHLRTVFVMIPLLQVIQQVRLRGLGTFAKPRRNISISVGLFLETHSEGVRIDQSLLDFFYLFIFLLLHKAVVSLFIRSVGPTDVPIPAESAIPGQDIPGI